MGFIIILILYMDQASKGVFLAPITSDVKGVMTFCKRVLRIQSNEKQPYIQKKIIFQHKSSNPRAPQGMILVNK